MNPLEYTEQATTQHQLLERLVSQTEKSNSLRELELKQKEVELKQQADLIKATYEKTQAEEVAYYELKKANEINEKQIEIVARLLKDVEDWVSYFKTGTAERAFKEMGVKLDTLSHVIEAMILNRTPDETTTLLLSLLRGGNDGVVTQRGRSNSAIIRLVDETLITNALLLCGTIQDNFDSVRSDLPAEISSRIKGSDKRIVQVRELVRVCVQFGNIQDLIKIVGYYEGDSLAFKEVIKLVDL